MHCDFSKIDDTHSFVSVPEGTYPCKIAEVRERVARDGSAQWSFRLEVLEGEYAGRTAAWDSITWSEKGLSRVKLVLGALGFDTSGPLELEAVDLSGRCARVSLSIENHEDPVTGVRTLRPRVPFTGYARAADGLDGVGAP